MPDTHSPPGATVPAADPLVSPFELPSLAAAPLPPLAGEEEEEALPMQISLPSLPADMMLSLPADAASLPPLPSDMSLAADAALPPLPSDMSLPTLPTNDPPPAPTPSSAAPTGPPQHGPPVATATTSTSPPPTTSTSPPPVNPIAPATSAASTASTATTTASSETTADATSSGGATTEGEDEVMRQLSTNLSTLSIDMRPVSLSLDLADHHLLPPPPQHPAPAAAPAAAPLPPTAPGPADPPVGVIYDESMQLHVGPARHPECPERVAVLFQHLADARLLDRCWTLPPRQATDKELLRAHTAEHVRKVEATFTDALAESPETTLVLNLDTYYGPDTARAARTAAGCCIEAVQQVLVGRVQRALAVVRPPGHHAECERAMGFCFFNNTGLAALAALTHPGVKRVAVLDWDVHHGNGIQDVLLRRPDALYVSVHRGDNFYPFTSGFLEEVGAGPGVGFNVNLPWGRRGEGDADYLAALDLLILPILRAYAPDLLIVSAGFDAADGDPLGGCCVTPGGYAHMTKRLLEVAGGKVVLALEGGYNTRVTAECAAACMEVLLGGEPARLEGRRAARPLAGTEGTLDKATAFHAHHWPVLEPAGFGERWKAWVAAHEAAHSRPRRRGTDDYVVY